jgi:ABC-type transporter MlaC component
MALEQPKKPAGGAYGRFMAENRAKFIAECKGKPITEVSKLGSVRFKELSDAQKAVYQKQFEDAQAQYKKDMEAFEAAGGERKAVKRKGKDDECDSKRRKKDPDAPKKPAGGAYGIFLNKNRPKFMEQTKGQPITAISKLAGEEWKKLSEKEKEPFQKEYEKTLAAYKKALEEYNAKHGAAADVEEEEEPAEEVPEEKGAKPKAAGKSKARAKRAGA